MRNSLIGKASRGDQSAAMALYHSQSARVLCLCQSLLLDENEADHATAQIFKKVWSELFSGRIEDENAFSRLTVRQAILYCKALALKKSSRAFRVPAGSVFVVNFDPAKMDLTGSPQRIILRNLPVFQRFVYVIRTVADYSEEEIARILGTTPKAVCNALYAEDTNIERIAAAIPGSRRQPTPITAEIFRDALIKDVLSTKVPAAVDSVVRLNASELCAPVRKREKEKKLGITAIVAVLTVLAVVIVLSTSGGGNSDIDLENPDPDASVSATVGSPSSDTDPTASPTADANGMNTTDEDSIHSDTPGT